MKEVTFTTNIQNKKFSVHSKKIDDVKVKLTNKKGRTIKLRSENKKNNKTFNIKKLRKGTYNIEISNSKYKFNKKLTIEKKK